MLFRSYARSSVPERLEILLLIAVLAHFVLWLVGLAAHARGWSRHFQANTERSRPVLSLPFLGQELWRTPNFELSLHDLSRALQTLINTVAIRGALT